MAEKPANKSKSKSARAASKFFDGAPHGVLSGYVDRFKGITIDETQINPNMTVNEFQDLLTRTLEVYKSQSFRGIWLKLNKLKAHLAGVAV